MVLRIVLTVMMLLAPLIPPVFARTPAAAPVPLSEHDRLRADMEGQVERLKLNVETFMATQDKRVGDLQLHASRTNDLIALLAMIVIIATVGMAFKFAGGAKQEARKAVKDWLREKTAAELAKKLEAFDGKLEQMAAERLAQASAAIDERASPLIAKLEEGCVFFDSMTESLGNSEMARTANEPAGSVSGIARDLDKLRPAAGAAMAKAPANRDFNDWYLMAWASMTEDQFAAAYHHFVTAQSVGAPDQLLALKAGYNGARAAMCLGYWDDAITLLDAVLEQWQEGGVEDGEALAIASFLGKGFALGQLKRNQDALEVYNAALDQSWDMSNPDVVNVRARISLCRGLAHHRLGAADLAERRYDEFIRDYARTTDKVLQGDLARALYNKMRLRKKAKDTAEENRLLDEIDRRFGAAGDPELAGIIKSVKSAIAARKTKLADA